jgi:hypothetical protein
MRCVCPSFHVTPRKYALFALAVLATGSVSCSSDAPVAPDPVVQAGAVAHAGVNDANAIVVTNAAELVAALVPANAGEKILVRSGSYDVSQRLVVPDGVTLAGEGDMQFDGSGLPTGFAAGTRTTIRMTSNVLGDFLTLGDGSSISDIAVEDLPGRVGSVVAVGSRSAGDSVSATISEVEITNPNVHAIVLTGPSGCGVTMVTQNPHPGSAVSVSMTHSLIHSPATGTGCGVFAFNFASLSSVSVSLSDNVIGGGMIANGGVSRPAAVHDSKTVVQSRENLYIDDSSNPCVSRRVGWNLAGGSGVPAPIQIGETLRNALRVHSQDDRIEGVTMAILATGGRRFFALPTAGPVTDNTIDLDLIGTTISTSSCGGASFVTDFRIAGALVTNATLAPGDGNTVHAVMRGVTGSGTRTNFYADVLGPTGPLAPQYQGTGNRLEIAGTVQSFGQTNQSIDPAPPAEFFIGGR